MRTADLYVRVSTDEQADKGYSQRNQEEVLRRYCTTNNIQVRKVVLEDHSAKSFNRPAWSGLLFHLRKFKGQTDLILFTKWDRFSRNAGDAYQMISTLRKLGIEPQAVEQPLDLSVPENKMMLAFYLAAPEVENDRRALNVFFGMRRAKKEGRWMGSAPLGYSNKISETGRKYIAPHETDAQIMRWVFAELAEGLINTEQVLKQARKKGLRCSKNNFWVAIRNPVYCGKILIPKYKDDDAHVVRGQHEPLVTETLFYDVQDVLDGRKKKQRTKQSADESLPLRGFLLCPRCSHVLTGSASKGRNHYYHYYHCTSVCGFRMKAEEANKAMITELSRYTPRKGMSDLFKTALLNAYEQQVGYRSQEKNHVLTELDKVNDRLKNARLMRADKEMDADDFIVVKQECEKRVEELERLLMTYSQKDTGINELIGDTVDHLMKLDTLYEFADVIDKRKIVGSIFREKLVFENGHYRTASVNEPVRCIYLINKALEGKKNGTSCDFSSLSHEVIPLGHCFFLKTLMDKAFYASNIFCSPACSPKFCIKNSCCKIKKM